MRARCWPAATGGRQRPAAKGDGPIHDCDPGPECRRVHRRAASAVHQRAVGGRGVGQDVRDPQPGDRRDPRPRRRRRRRGQKPGRAGGAEGVRGRPVEPDDAVRAQPDHLADRRPDRGARGGAGAARVAGQRQAVPGRAGRGRAAGRGLVPLHGRVGDEDRGQYDQHLGAVYAGGEFPFLYAAGAAGRGGADHPVELPAADGGVEAGPGAGHRQHRGAQAGRADPADRAAAR
jgi:hypothetical protein